MRSDLLALLFLLYTHVGLAAPAPVPAPVRKIEDVFGKVVHTRGLTCTLTRQGGLRSDMAKEMASDAEAQLVTRPLVTRRVEGDFEVTVRITHVPPNQKTAVIAGEGNPTVSAGIALYPPDKPEASFTFLQQHIKDGDTWKSDFFTRTQYNQEVFESNRRPGKRLDRGPVYLRLTRRGDEFTSAWSHDGKRWTPASVQGQFGFRAAVLIGPAVAHNTTAGHEVVFDDYVLTRPSGKKK